MKNNSQNMKTPLIKQRGVASLIVVLLVGLAVLALSAATLYSIHGTQDRQIAAHAQVNSQLAAWTEVENVRLYFASLTQAQIDALAAGTLATGNNNLKVEITSIANTAVANTKQITALVTAKATAGEASSRIQVVYEVSAGAAATNTILGGSMLKGNTTINGGMDFTGETGHGLDFTIDGNLTVQSAGIGGPGLRALTVTGETAIGSSVDADILQSNGNVTLTSGASVSYIYTLGNLTTDNASMRDIQYIRADGNVNIQSASYIDRIDALGTITVNAWGHYGTFTSGGDLNLTIGAVALGQSKGNITQGPNNWTDTNDSRLRAEGTITCSGGKPYREFRSNSTISEGNCLVDTLNRTRPQISLPPPQAPFPAAAPLVDVWALKSQANYVYEYINNTMKVTIKNVSNIPDGQYNIINGTEDPDHANAYICINNATTCSITTGNSIDKIYINNALSQGGSISYNPSTHKWWLAGGNIAPGVAWFDGDLTIAGGTYFNTFLVTGNIDTAGSITVISPNSAGNAGLCVFEDRDKQLMGVMDKDHQNQMLDIDERYSPAQYARTLPTNLCDTSNSPTRVTINGTTYTKLKTNSIGNIALAAGGTNPSASPSVFTGGDILLTAGNSIYGNVLAGEQLNTSGNSAIFGRFIAADLRQGHNATNQFWARLVVNSSMPGIDFDSSTVPNMSTTPSSPSAKLLWSQYP